MKTKPTKESYPDLTYEQWRALGVNDAVKYLQRWLDLTPARARKLEKILRHEWKEKS